MNDRRLAELKAHNVIRRVLKEAATPALWRHLGRSGDGKIQVIVSDNDPRGQLTIEIDSDDCDRDQAVRDCSFIVAARNDVVEDEVDELLTEVKRLQGLRHDE